MSSQRDYTRAIKIITSEPKDHRDLIMMAFIRFFEEANPNFDRSRFRAACAGEDEVTKMKRTVSNMQIGAQSCNMCGAVPAGMGNHHNTNCGFWTKRPAHKVSG